MARFGAWWEGLRTSLWFAPSAMTALAVILAWVTVEIDRILLTDRRADFYLAFSGGAEGARGILSAIAGSIITVTGVVFSITIVALQLASSQFTPRVLRTFTRDPVNQVVLGVFLATFTYTLLVLRTVRSATEDGQVFVPSISVALAIGLALVSIGCLIFYIHHVARSIRASVIVDRATNDTLGLVDELFPEPLGEPADRPESGTPAGEPARVTAEGSGYLQAVDADALFDLADKGELTVRMEPRIGAFVLPGATVATVWPAEVVDQDAAERIRRAFVLGSERTLQQDLELGFRQLTDIAIRALSPGVNDPTTATICVDRLAQILVTLGNRRLPERAQRGGDGRVCFVARETTFERAVELSFDQIRHYGAGDPAVAAHVLHVVQGVAELVPDCCRAPLARQVEALLRAVKDLVDEPSDRARVERAGERAMDAAAGAITPTSER